MTLSEVGEARVRGYLFMLSRSLRSFLDAEAAGDALREVESHILERLDQVEGGDERAVVERVLAEVGTPLQVAQAYSSEVTVDEAVTTGRFLPVVRAIWHYATTSVVGFAWAVTVFVGWATGLSFAAIAPIKLIFPNNVGVFYVNGRFSSAGAVFGLPPGTVVEPFGYWVVPVSLALGLVILLGTHRASRAVLAWLRSRKSPARFRLRVEVKEG
jgi:uncharacterized membrane protein